jgi:RES domain-containing protein
MIFYRLTTDAYSGSIDGIGAKKYGGRWNPIDYAMLYGASHISLAALEILVHNESRFFLPKYVLLEIKLPEAKIKTLQSKELKKNWIFDMYYTQSIGKDFLESDLFIMQVPSIIIPREFNVLVNPNHQLFKKIKIMGKENFEWDKRLLK